MDTLPTFSFLYCNREVLKKKAGPGSALVHLAQPLEELIAAYQKVYR